MNPKPPFWPHSPWRGLWLSLAYALEYHLPMFSCYIGPSQLFWFFFFRAQGDRYHLISISVLVPQCSSSFYCNAAFPWLKWVWEMWLRYISRKGWHQLTCTIKICFIHAYGRWGLLMPSTVVGMWPFVMIIGESRKILMKNEFVLYNIRVLSLVYTSDY